MLNKGANPNAPDSDNHTPLFCATIYGLHGNNIEIVELLLEHDAIINNSTGFHLIALALFFKIDNLLEIIKLFKKYNVDINAKDGTGCTALHLAIETNTIKKIVKIEVVIALINAGANIELTNNEGLTPLHIAAKSGHKKVVEILIEHGADVNIQDNFNCTPLHWAAQHGHTEVVRFLIEHNATIDAKDNSATLLYLAAFHNHIKTFILLLLYGADVSAEDRQEINEKPKLASCLAEFEEIKELPHLGGLIEAHKNKDTKAISKYINNVKNQEALIEEFKGIKEHCTNEQLSFVPEYLSDFVEHMILNYMINHKETNAIRDMAHLAKNPTQNKVDVPEEMFENIASFLDNQSLKNLHLAYHMSTDEDYGRAMNLLKRMKATESVLDQPGAVGLENLFRER